MKVYQNTSIMSRT